MRDEFTSQKSFMDRLNDLASSVLQYLNTNNLSTVRITEQMDVIHQLWNDMSAKLNEREKNLEAASGISKGFHKNLTELQVKLQQLNEKFDKFEDKGFSSDTFLKKLGVCIELYFIQLYAFLVVSMHVSFFQYNIKMFYLVKMLIL